MIILSFLSFTSLPSRMEARDVWCLPPVWNLRAVTWFRFSIPSLVLKSTLSPSLSVLSLFSFWSVLLPYRYLDFFIDFVSIQKDIFVFVALFFVVVFKQLGDDDCLMMGAAFCHLALVFAVVQFYVGVFNFMMMFVKGVIVKMSDFFFLTWYWRVKQKGQWCQHLLALCAVWCKGNIEGTTSFWNVCAIVMYGYMFCSCETFTEV